jgi:hypothetical protein
LVDVGSDRAEVRKVAFRLKGFAKANAALDRLKSSRLWRFDRKDKLLFVKHE